MLNENTFKHKTFVATISIFIAIIIILYFSYLNAKKHLTNHFEIYLKKSYYNLVFPLQYSLAQATSWTRNIFVFTKEYQKKLDQLEKIDQELLKHQNNFAFINQLRKENQELKRLLGYKNNIIYKTILAKVIAKDPQNFFSTLVINKGKLDSIQEDMIAVSFYQNSYALVGFIESTSDYSSVIRTIIDQQCRVSVYIDEFSSLGIMKGQIPVSFNTIIEFLDKNLINLIDKEVITSGVNPKYPKNIRIGHIIEVANKQQALFQSAIVKPHINFFTLEDILILMQKNP